MNGVKHGWISGFESGAIYGIKKIFTDAYINNINLFQKLGNYNK